jgi:transposase
MDVNARPHRARIVQHFLQQEAVQTITWPAMSPDMNPIEHVWDFIGRKINQRNLPICEVFIILKDVTMTWQKWDSKQALEKRKTSLSLMKVFTIVKILTN